MKYWTAHQRRRHAPRPPHRVDSERPLGHPTSVPEGKDWKRLGDLVLQCRAEQGLSQQQLADRMDVVPKTVRTLEKGRPVALTTVAMVDSALGLPSGTALLVLNGQEIPTPARRTPAPAPGEATFRDLQREYDYFGERFKDSPEDFPRLMRLLNMYLQLQLRERGIDTERGDHRETG